MGLIQNMKLWCPCGTKAFKGEAKSRNTVLYQAGRKRWLRRIGLGAEFLMP